MEAPYRRHRLPLHRSGGVKVAIWFESLKPKVYIASVAPVVIGSALAWADGHFDVWSMPLLLICAMLIQTISNWVNDIYDHKRGADERGRVGPRRVLVEGLLQPQQLIRASWIAAIICFLLGLPLVVRAGWPVLLIGLVCLIAAWAYTGGRFNLAYHGLGDVAAFLLFGVVGVVGTYYVHAIHLTSDAFLLALGPGCIVANILGVNNIRDIPTDTLVGKRTLAVRIGGRPARLLYIILMLVAIILPSIVLRDRGPWLYAPLAALPWGLTLCIMVWKRQGADLNPVLVGTAVVYVQYTVLMAIGLMMSGLR